MMARRTRKASSLFNTSALQDDRNDFPVKPSVYSPNVRTFVILSAAGATSDRPSSFLSLISRMGQRISTLIRYVKERHRSFLEQRRDGKRR